MVFGFIKKTIGRLRELSGQKSKKGIFFPFPSPNEMPKDFVMPESFVQARRFLLKEGLPVGRSRSSRHPDIRCVPVKNFSEAYRFFLRLCDQRLLVIRQSAGILHYRMQLSDGTVIFDLTDKITGKPDGTVAVLRINNTKFDAQITEIEFVQLKKIKK